ncbi:MAG: hypothetical protein ACD_44C00013G0001 [uncultured bacterium]|nr:MAG: hypothetical protein ACD_44C00013G0001 [uncultured bacterium]
MSLILECGSSSSGLEGSSSLALERSGNRESMLLETEISVLGLKRFSMFCLISWFLRTCQTRKRVPSNKSKPAATPKPMGFAMSKRLAPTSAAPTSKSVIPKICPKVFLNILFLSSWKFFFVFLSVSGIVSSKALHFLSQPS